MADYSRMVFAERYALIRQLAVGGMGEIFLAQDQKTDDLVVVKRILRANAENPQFVDMFLDEARLTTQLDHPNVVRVHDVGCADGQYYITMEYLDGHDLGRIVTRATRVGRPLSVAHALQIVHDMAAGAHYAHSRADADGRSLGIVHRDLSPRNIMVTCTGGVKILDFGLAKARTQTHVTLPGKIKGTPSYLAPEQLTGKPPTPAADIFAMGTVLYELTTQRRLFRRATTLETMRAVKTCDVPRPHKVIADYPPPVEEVVLKALQRHPDDRYTSAELLRTALAGAMAQLGVERSTLGLGRCVQELFVDATSQAELRNQLRSFSPDATIAEGLGTWFPLETSTLVEDRSNLPVHKTRFVGRRTALQRLSEVLAHGERLITLHGPPGTGKTRLAIEVGHTALDAYRDSGGVWLCELEGTRGLEEVCGIVAAVLGVPLQADADASSGVHDVGSALAGRGRVLLLLDNVEQVLGIVRDALLRWRELAPEATFLVTSRERLQLDGAWALEVAPLPVPPSGSAAETDATELFLDRARLARPGWKPDEHERVIIGTIVRHLDGIPLALELAAARLGELTAPGLLEQLSRRFDVLKSPGGGREGRHDTLLGAIDWSWNLLQPWEQAALAQCATFHGGFDMEAADAVIDLRAWSDAPWVVDVLQALTNKSLLRAHTAAGFPGEPRCRQYVIIRDYARRRLEESQDGGAAMTRHRAHFTRFGRFWSREAGQRRGVEGRRRISLETPNLLAVHRRSVREASGSAEAAIAATEAALSLFVILSIRGPFAGYLRLLDKTIAATRAQLPPGLQGELMLARAHMRRVHGHPDAANADIRAVLELARRGSDGALAARGLSELGALRLSLGQSGAAENVLRQALRMHGKSGDVDWQGRTLLAMGNVCLMRGEVEKARVCLERALPRFRAVGEVVLEGACLGNLGTLEQAAGRLPEARRHLERAVALFREVGAPRFEGYALNCLGSVSHESGDTRAAGDLYRRGLRVLREVGDRRWEAVALAHLGVLMHEEGRHADAHRDLSEALRLLAAIGGVPRIESFLRGALGAVEAGMGRLKQAEANLDAAEAVARDADDPLLAPALDLYRAFLDVAEGLQAQSVAAAELLMDAARERLTAGLAACRQDSVAEGPMIRSDLMDLYRLAVRILGRTLAQATGE